MTYKNKHTNVEDLTAVVVALFSETLKTSQALYILQWEFKKNADK